MNELLYRLCKIDFILSVAFIIFYGIPFTSTINVGVDYVCSVLSPIASPIHQVPALFDHAIEWVQAVVSSSIRLPFSKNWKQDLGKPMQTTTLSNLSPPSVNVSEHWRRLWDWSFCPSFWVSVCVSVCLFVYCTYTLRRHISITVPDRRMVAMDHL